MRLAPRGVLVAFEGIDGAGKTTQAARLAEWLGQAGFELIRRKEPTSGRWGQLVRDTSLTGRLPAEKELEAFLSDREEHVREVIGPELARGTVVIVDRYYYSTAAYQGARGLDPVEILRRNEAFAPRPDVLVLLDIPLEEAMRRIASRGEVENLFERREDLAKSEAIFRTFEGPHVLRLDGTLGVDVLSRKVLDTVCELPAVKTAIYAEYGSGNVPALTEADAARVAEVDRIAQDANLSPHEKALAVRRLFPR